MRAEIIAIGDELTSGQRLDTNSQWLSERLGEIGMHVAFHTTVGDDLEDNIAAADLALGLRILADLLESGLPVTRALHAFQDLAPRGSR